MNEKHTQLNNNVERFSLTHEERERMRRVVFSYMEMKPLRVPVARARPARNFYAAFLTRPAAALLVVALFAVSGGVSLAAQGALPGDFLYPIKTRVNEPLRGALAASASAKSAWAMEVAGERIKEATTLAAESRLSAAAQDEIQASFDAHAKEAAGAIAQEASTSPDTGAATAVRFEAQLSEYGRVLAQVGVTRNASSQRLVSSIRNAREQIAGIQASTLISTETAATATTSKNTLAAFSMRAAAKEQLETSAALARAGSGALDASSSAQVARQLESASRSIASGEALLSGNAAPQANAAFQSALSAAEKLGVFLQTSAAIHARTGLLIGVPGNATTSAAKQKRDGSGYIKDQNSTRTDHHDTTAAQTVISTSSQTNGTGSAGGTQLNPPNASGDRNTGSQDDRGNSGGSHDTHSLQRVIPISVPTDALP